MGEIIVREKLYVPTNLVSERKVQKRYTHRFYEEAACRMCENRAERHNSICDACPAYLGTNLTANRKLVNGVEYFGLPLGDKKNYKNELGLVVNKHTVKDLRCKAKFDYDVKMVDFKLRDYQEPSVDLLAGAKYGVLKAPPRSGKTPTMLYAGVAKFGYKIVMIADQREFLQQFLDHVTEFTNLPELEQKHKKKLYGIGKKPEHFKEYQIIACTYQSLATKKGKKLLSLLNKNFGTAFIDEAHSAAAKVFSKVVNSLAQYVRIGATGTNARKQIGYYDIVKQVIGPVTAEIKIDQLQPLLYVHPIDFVKSRSAYKGKAGFSYLVNFLSSHKKRNDFILEWVLKDLSKGHSIIMPLYRKEHVVEMVKRINDEYGKPIAAAFMGGGSAKDKFLREQVLDDARSGKVRVVVGIRSLLQRGLNVERWSMHYNVMPINNEPNWKQESSRILTPMEGKRQPAIRFFVDENIRMCLGCFVGTYRHSIKFKHKPTPTAQERALALFKKSNSRGELEGDALEGDTSSYSGTRKYVRPFSN